MSGILMIFKFNYIWFQESAKTGKNNNKETDSPV